MFDYQMLYPSYPECHGILRVKNVYWDLMNSKICYIFFQQLGRNMLQTLEDFRGLGWLDKRWTQYLCGKFQNLAISVKKFALQGYFHGHLTPNNIHHAFDDGHMKWVDCKYILFQHTKEYEF